MPLLMLESAQALKDFAGKEIAATDWLTVTQDRIDRFAAATEDRQWIHVDPERAQRESPYGATIAHGFLTLSLLSHFMTQAVQFKDAGRMAINYGLNRVRFPSAVVVNSKIRARVRLLSCKEVSSGLEAAFSMAIETQNSNKPCCVAEWIVRYLP